jgi:hypothetical protein
MSPREISSGVQESFEELRQLLIEHPADFSTETAAPALLRATEGLLALQNALEQTSDASTSVPSEQSMPSEQLRELLLLSSRVQALYGQGMAFYGGLAAELVANGAWDAASYGPDGLLRT